jgi:hypothetical protein
MVPFCNSGNSGRRDQDNTGSKPDLANSSGDSVSKILNMGLAE